MEYLDIIVDKYQYKYINVNYEQVRVRKEI